MKPYSMLLAVFAAAGCGPQISVYTDYEPSYDLRAHRTFSWATAAEGSTNRSPLYYSDLNDRRIKVAVQSQLESLGYSFSETQPNFTLHYHIIVDDKAVLSPEAYGYYYGPYWMNIQTNVQPYREGTLIVDVMDTPTRRLVWRGWAVSPMVGDYTPAQIDALIQRAVTGMFKKFPAAVAGPRRTTDSAPNKTDI